MNLVHSIVISLRIKSLTRLVYNTSFIFVWITQLLQVFHENLYPNDDKKALEDILADSTKPKLPIDIQSNEIKKEVPCENTSSKEKSDPTFNKNNEDKIEENKKQKSIDDIQISMEKSSLSESRPKPKRGSAMSRFREKVKNSAQNWWIIMIIKSNWIVIVHTKIVHKFEYM